MGKKLTKEQKDINKKARAKAADKARAQREKVARLTAAREKNASLIKDEKKADKNFEKAEAESEKYSPENISALEQAAFDKVDKEIEELEQSNAAKKTNIETKDTARGLLEVETKRNMKQLDLINSAAGYHKNSHHKISKNPYTYAIPNSIIGTCKKDFPGMFRATVNQLDKVIAMTSLDSRLKIDCSDMTTCKLFLDNVLCDSRHYAYGLTKWIKEFITTNLKKAA